MLKKSIIKVTLTPTVDTNIYASGDNVGGKMTFLSVLNRGVSGIIRGCTISDAAQQSSDMDLVLFEGSPSATTFTDNVALDIADADLPKIITVLNFTSYDAFVDNSYATLDGLSIPYNKNKTLYGALISRGTPTYVAATDIDVTLTVEIS